MPVLDALAEKGYAPRTTTTYRLMTGRLCSEAETWAVTPDALDADGMRELAETCPNAGSANMERKPVTTARRLTDYLIKTGVGAIVGEYVVSRGPDVSDKSIAGFWSYRSLVAGEPLPSRPFLVEGPMHFASKSFMAFQRCWRKAAHGSAQPCGFS